MDISKSWVAIMQRQLKTEYPHYNIVNASISGETSSAAIGNIHQYLQQHKPTIVIIELGGNDGLRGSSIDTIYSNLQQIIRRCMNINSKVLLLGMKIPPNYGKAYADAFHNIYFRLAKYFDIPLLPFMLKDIANQQQLMQADNIHPNVAAQQRISANVWPYLSPLL